MADDLLLVITCSEENPQHSAQVRRRRSQRDREQRRGHTSQFSRTRAVDLEATVSICRGGRRALNSPPLALTLSKSKERQLRFRRRRFCEPNADADKAHRLSRARECFRKKRPKT